MEYEGFRPNSPEYWRERRRQYEVREERRRRYRRLAGAILGGVVLLALLVYASTLIPDNVSGRVKDVGRELMRR